MNYTIKFNVPSNVKAIFRSLKYRNYRLYFVGQGISLIGTFMQQVALCWLVYRLTNSPLLLGIVGFASQIPIFIFSPFAGVIADRHNRRSMLIIIQISLIIQASILSYLVLSGHIQVWHIIILSVMRGIIDSVDMPIRQSFTVEMIENREDLSNAIAMNSIMMNMARIIGPSMTGLLIASAGEGVCFLLNAIGGIPVLISLLAMKIMSQPIKSNGRHIFSELLEGFRYVFDCSPIKYILLLVSLVSVAGVPYQILMPVFAVDIFHGGPHTLGILMAMPGLGALIGAVYLASRKTFLGLKTVIAVAAGLLGISLMCFSFSSVLWISMIILIFSGGGLIVQMASSNTVLQTLVEEEKRGRVTSFYIMFYVGLTPFGNLLAGGLTSKIGAPTTLLLGGLCCLIGAILFTIKLPLIRKKAHEIYVKKGVISKVAKGMQSAT